MVERKSIDEFRKTGLLLFINQFLHIFGWVIVVYSVDGKSVSMYPARSNYRGFKKEDIDEAYVRISKYMNENSSKLLEEAEEE